MSSLFKFKKFKYRLIVIDIYKKRDHRLKMVPSLVRFDGDYFLASSGLTSLAAFSTAFFAVSAAAAAGAAAST